VSINIGPILLVLLATDVSADDERFAQGLGARRFLPKPLDADELFIAVADALTGQVRATALMAVRESYTGYEQCLESRLPQKSALISRRQQQLEGLPDDQNGTYLRLTAGAQGRYDEIQRELVVLSKLPQGLE
jgi:DNA-binding NarL/FixJ family response regulator